jgi:O-antigen ligase
MLHQPLLRDQWFGKTFWTTLGALAGCFLLSLTVFHNFGEGIFLAVAGSGLLVLTVWRLEYGLFAAFAELFANSHGHLVSTEVYGFDLSLREVVFLAVMAGWLIWMIRNKSQTFSAPTPFCLLIKTPFWIYFLPIIFAIIIGCAIGFAQNEAGKAFNDGNGYFYLAYLLPILSVNWDSTKRRQLLQVLAAAAVWIVILTLGLLYLFTHLSGQALVGIYRFIRDTRTGELTNMSGIIFRIFLQGQFSVIVFAFLLAPWLWLKEIPPKIKSHLVLILAWLVGVILISLSRSFWLGIIVAVVPFIVLLIRFLKPKIKNFASGVGLGFFSGLLALFILAVVALFPIPNRLGSFSDLTWLFASRTSDLEGVAISSRWNLLPEMWKEIKVAPLLGSGFGEEITFKTDDPRARAISPDGTWTTYAFEWGWLDLWLKMGILGPLAFLWLFLGLIRGLLSEKNRPDWLTIGLVSGLVMLYATHVFSPYLNHPLGLGFILFIVPFLGDRTREQILHIPSAVDLPVVLPKKSAVFPATTLSRF